jgi:catechol 2,3-dioxygenase-like lactoylglutathione lyase family enzyme
MAIIKVADIAYGRLRSPDLDVAEEFLTDFGLVKVERTADRLYMRGTDPTHHIHVTEKGDPGFVGFAYFATSLDDLTKLSKAPGASGVENIDEPGGGKRVRLKEPNGYQIEVVYGMEQLKPLDVQLQQLNSGPFPLNRKNELMRLKRQPSRPKKMAHGVMGSPKLDETVKWFREYLGMIGSDDVYAGSKENIIGSFNRCDRGDDYVDHHVFFCIRHAKAGLNHFSYEVQDIDDVFVGHEFLKAKKKYEHMWGLGRHLLGSQVYDYWADPWGRVHEHWADSDRLNASHGSNLIAAEDGLISQWGEGPPPKMLDRILA